MTHESIEVIYEDGVFKPLERLELKPNTRGRVIVISDEDQDGSSALEAQKEALGEIVGVGASGHCDAARRHNDIIYGSG